jgi:hypothetical protein
MFSTFGVGSWRVYGARRAVRLRQEVLAQSGRGPLVAFGSGLGVDREGHSWICVTEAALGGFEVDARSDESSGV